MGVKFTSESEMERSLINELVSGVSQWTYRADLKSEADLWNNFKNKLEKNGINVTIRREMGRDIDGACGQLRKKHIDKERGIN